MNQKFDGRLDLLWKYSSNHGAEGIRVIDNLDNLTYLNVK
jgi:hypothetical protein